MKTFSSLISGFIFICALLLQSAEAQNSRKDEIESLKTAFITKKVDLTPEEARSFWPVYNQYQNDLETLRKRRREEIRSARMDFDKLSDKELEKIVDGEIAARQNELDLLKKYHPLFKQILPVRKVARLYKAEEEFKKELLRRIRENRN